MFRLATLFVVALVLAAPSAVPARFQQDGKTIDSGTLRSRTAAAAEAGSPG